MLFVQTEDFPGVEPIAIDVVTSIRARGPEIGGVNLVVVCLNF